MLTAGTYMIKKTDTGQAGQVVVAAAEVLLWTWEHRVAVPSSVHFATAVFVEAQ